MEKVRARERCEHGRCHAPFAGFENEVSRPTIRECKRPLEAAKKKKKKNQILPQGLEKRIKNLPTPSF